MNIRGLRKQDFENGLIECYNALAETDFTGRKWAIPIFTGRRQDSNVWMFVAVDDDERVLGTASVFLYPTYLHGGAYAAHIEDVAVHPDHQRKGIGRALVEHCLKRCRLANVYKVVLNCSPANIPFYQKCGFRLTPDGLMRCNLEG